MSLLVDIKKKLGDFTLDVSFDTDSKSLGLFGLSGSGKSVTLKCIAGLITPDSGRIIIDGLTVFDSDRRINLPPQKRNIGYLPQNYALFPNMTVEKNILTGLHKFDKEERTEKLNEYICRFDLESVRKLYPHQISGGQAQRVALARALATNPHILLLDEPFSALDEQKKTDLQIYLNSVLSDYNGIVVFVTHNRHEIYSHCDSVCTIADGFVDSLSAIDDVINNPIKLSDAVLLGVDNIGEILSIENNTALTEFGLSFHCDDVTSCYVAFNCDDSNCRDCDITFNAKVMQIMQDIDCAFLILQVNKDTKYIKQKINKENLHNYTINQEIEVKLNSNDILFIK